VVCGPGGVAEPKAAEDPLDLARDEARLPEGLHPSRIGGGIMMSRISIATSVDMSNARVSRNATTECVQASRARLWGYFETDR
jgi:hypothetical protein